MEEVGLRGATTSVDVVDPDVAIILESDIAGDVPGIKPEESAVKLGQGPTLVVFDARMIPNLKLRDLVVDTAKELEHPAAVFGPGGWGDRWRGDSPAQVRRPDGRDRRGGASHSQPHVDHSPRRLR